ncbi:hypothetical protein M427DRAFT_250812 [Gonapodya prolifera JEL478]|uniref:Transmembrane protein n=1 Tax=Gonapodya prolifera (strain JEL478) TaxID=1344416 RepID=A0A138ZXB5_GONPJ|nr:hypothetical protein M427DRAFT_250812 [Gonapodya prolifera JEL478]|eukprot:KXS09137.1 hypothetical protein M427DRAFT_250812 [Gonapodya prolifera JEL478]
MGWRLVTLHRFVEESAVGGPKADERRLTIRLAWTSFLDLNFAWKSADVWTCGFPDVCFDRTRGSISFPSDVCFDRTRGSVSFPSDVCFDRTRGSVSFSDECFDRTWFPFHPPFIPFSFPSIPLPFVSFSFVFFASFCGVLLSSFRCAFFWFLPSVCAPSFIPQLIPLDSPASAVVSLDLL